MRLNEIKGKSMTLEDLTDLNRGKIDWMAQGNLGYFGNHLDAAMLERNFGMSVNEFAKHMAGAKELSLEEKEEFEDIAWELPEFDLKLKGPLEYYRFTHADEFYVVADHATGLYHIWN